MSVGLPSFQVFKSCFFLFPLKTLVEEGKINRLEELEKRVDSSVDLEFSRGRVVRLYWILNLNERNQCPLYLSFMSYSHSCVTFSCCHAE